MVKWAATAGKVNACEVNIFTQKKKRKKFILKYLSKKEIQHFLEIRARLIRETSDSLAQLAREKLLDAR